ncbi:DUF1634 domain-containing protein [Taibaiella lutea]|uniref:DUF1634 domain-containing protein n=1 Tax=Taibaiella lutea TaxID=2608001 RepID=A0A5M6CVX7_9BACT|nr:DUF1634 domain-containing protein [Taibaiella lutea]KAA5537389.1 DUF1634 domain-containing protein [Taibaiella lutea]
MKSFQDKDLQSFIGNLLRVGVLTAMTIVVIGIVLYMFQYGHETIHYSTFKAENAFKFADFYQRLMSGNSSAIMELGVIVLIVIPIARVLFTMIGFWLEKDRMYTIIAFIVLCIIAYSLFFGVTSH